MCETNHLEMDSTAQPTSGSGISEARIPVYSFRFSSIKWFTTRLMAVTGLSVPLNTWRDGSLGA